MRRFLVPLLSVVVVIAGGMVVLVIYAASADLAPLVRNYANALTGRPIRLASLHLDLEPNLHFSANDLRLPAAIDPKLPDVAEAKRVEITIKLLPLLTGRVVIQSLTIDKLTVTLVRDADRRGNWATSRSHSSKSKRTTLPPLLDVTVNDAEITYAGVSGTSFPTHIEMLRLHTPSPADPVELEAKGKADQVPVTLQASLNSFDALQDLTKPFSGKVVLASGDNSLTWEGTATDPLNVDGLDGHADLNAERLNKLIASFGMTPPVANLALSLAGHLTVRNDDWRLRDSEGKLEGAAFTGGVEYDSQAGSAPDSLASTLNFDTLDLGKIMGKTGSGGPTKLPTVAEHPSMLFDVRLDAKSVGYKGFRLADLKTHVVRKPGQAALEQMQFGFAGGQVSVSATAEPASAGSHLTGSASMDGIDVRRLFQAAGASTPPLDGAAKGKLAFDVTGPTMPAALRNGRVTGAVSMSNGTISRNLIRMAQVNLQALWTGSTETTPLKCLLAAVDVHDGLGQVHPVRVKTPIGNLAAWGRVNLQRLTVDMTVRSQGDTSGLLALDLPIHITGQLSNPSMRPSPNFLQDQSPPTDSKSWPPGIRTIINSSACQAS